MIFRFSKLPWNTHRTFWIYVIILTSICVTLDLFLQDLWSRNLKSKQEQEVTLQLSSIRARLEESIYANLLLLHGLAAHLSIHPDTDAEAFAALAGEMMRQPNVLMNLSAAPDFVVRFTYPLEGNEAILGIDYRNLPDQWDQARLARDTGRLVLAGPLPLVQGGVGLVGRAPVFIRRTDETRFWGLVSAIMDMDRLIRHAGITEAQNTVDLAIRGRDGTGAEGEVFFGDGSLFDPEHRSIPMTVLLPNGTWRMVAVPKDGWRETNAVSYMIHAALFVFLLFIVVTSFRDRQKQNRLEKAEERYRTLFDVSPDGILVIDPQTSLPGQFNQAAHQQLGYTRDEFRNLHIADYEVIENPEETQNHIEKILKTGRDDFETVHRSKSGQLRNILVTVQLTDIGGRLELLTVFRDITRIRETEQGMRDLSQRLLLATRAGNIGVWDWDMHRGELTWDEQMYALYGVSPDEFSGLYQFWKECIHPDDREEAERLLQAALDGQDDFEAEFRIVRHNGHVRYIKAMASLVGQKGNPDYRLIGVNWDITAQKEAENRLREARRHASDILESTTDAFFEVDADFTLTYINSRAEQSLNLSHKEHVGRKLWELLPEGRDSLLYRECQRALKDRQVTNFETYNQSFDAWHEVWAYPTPTSLSVYFHDVTARKRLQEERERIFQLSIDMICVAGFDGYYKELNPSWERTLGWTREELMERPWLDFVHPDDVAATIEAGRDLIEGRSLISFENRYRCKDGSYRWISWNSYPVTDRFVIIAVARDVTENIKTREILRRDRDELETRVSERTVELAEANRDLLRAKEAAEAANRVKAAFLANITHELRTPLNPIIGLADYLQETRLDQEQKNFVADIQSSARRLLVIVNRLIELTRMESQGAEFNIQPFRVEELFDSLIREFDPLATQKGLVIQRQLSANVPGIIESDWRLLRQALYLLVENAVKFTDQGSVTLEADLDEDQTGGRYLHVTVTDTGPGLPPEKIETLFADLTQADGSMTRVHGGLGLGLTLARRIITAMDGKIRAENRDHGGSRFHLDIPFGDCCR
jgi:PAS domain S-box-containing protein